MRHCGPSDGGPQRRGWFVASACQPPRTRQTSVEDGLEPYSRLVHMPLSLTASQGSQRSIVLYPQLDANRSQNSDGRNYLLLKKGL